MAVTRPIIYKDPYFEKDLKESGVVLKISKETARGLFAARSFLYRLFENNDPKLRPRMEGLRRGKKFENGQINFLKECGR